MCVHDASVFIVNVLNDGLVIYLTPIFCYWESGCLRVVVNGYRASYSSILWVFEVLGGGPL